jgi:hypothetical protein
MVVRLAGVTALVLLGLALGGCGTKSSFGFKEKPTTTVSGGRTTRSTQGDDSLEDEPPPPPGDLEDPIDLGPGLHHPGCGAASPTATTTPTSSAPTTTTRPDPAFALVAPPGSATAPDPGC